MKKQKDVKGVREPADSLKWMDGACVLFAEVDARTGSLDPTLLQELSRMGLAQVVHPSESSPKTKRQSGQVTAKK